MTRSVADHSADAPFCLQRGSVEALRPSHLRALVLTCERSSARLHRSRPNSASVLVRLTRAKKTARPRTRASALVPSAGGSHGRTRAVRWRLAVAATASQRNGKPLATRAAPRPRRQSVPPRASSPRIGDDANRGGLNQGAPAGRLSIVCLGDYRQPGASVVARRSIRRALNRQIRESIWNPATRSAKRFSTRPMNGESRRRCRRPEPRSRRPRVQR